MSSGSRPFLCPPKRAMRSDVPDEGGVSAEVATFLCPPKRAMRSDKRNIVTVLGLTTVFLCPPKRAMRSDSSGSSGGLTSGDGRVCEHLGAAGSL